MPPVILPTRLERTLGARIHLKVFGRYVGTGHHFAGRGRQDTDDEESSSDDDDDA